MVMYMKDTLCVDELKRSITKCDDAKRKTGQEALFTMTARTATRQVTFMVKTVHLIDRLFYSAEQDAWVRLDWRVTYESRFLHCLSDMDQVSDKLKEYSARFVCLNLLIYTHLC